MTLYVFLADSGLDPEAVALLAEVFEAAWNVLLAERNPLAEPNNAEATRERLAKQVILSWQLGGRTKDELVAQTVAGLV